MSKPQDNILVIKLSALGDFVQSLGPMRAIRNHHKDSHITLLTTKPYVSLAEASGYFDNIIIDERPKFYQFLKWIKLREQLNALKLSRAYDLQNNDRTQIYFNMMRPKPEWVGTAKGASHQNKSKTRTNGLAFYGHKETLGLAGIHNIEIDTLEWISSDLSSLKLPKNYALIVAGSAPNHPEKRWPVAYYAALCNALCDRGITPVLIGTAAEKPVTEAIQKKCIKALNLNGKTSLFDIVALARNAILAIGNDTGPMHMIAPTGCKTIVLFSQNSNPRHHAPLGDNVICIRENNLENLKPKVVLEEIDLFL